MKRVLVLDDEADLEFIFRAMLAQEISSELLTLDYYTNPVSCLEYFRKRWPVYDFILCDINMPGLSGVEFVRQLRHLGYVAPIFFMSAYREEDYQKDMGELNVPLFIHKPVDFEFIRGLLLHGHTPIAPKTLSTTHLQAQG